MQQTYSLFQLNQHIRRVLALNLSEPVWVETEIAQCKSSRGHYYLEFVQKEDAEDGQIKAQASGILWSRSYRKLRRERGKVLEALLQDGVAVKLQVRVDFHERYGLKLFVEDIDPAYTLGQLAVKRKEIIARLGAEGLLPRNRQLVLPPVLQHIAVISSENAAGYEDFRQHLLGNPFGYAYRSVLFPAAMQGEQAEKEIIAQLKKIKRRTGEFDVVAIMRGGGARLDLNAFDSYDLGKAVAECPLPVLVGIGHEIDETVLDLVAHQSLKTPTALADFLLYHNERFEAGLQQQALSLQQTLSRVSRQKALELEHLSQRVRHLAQKQVQTAHSELELQTSRLGFLTKQPLQRAKEELRRHELILSLLDQQATLERGYAIIRKPEGTPLLDPEELTDQEKVEIQLAKGKTGAIIQKENQKS